MAHRRQELDECARMYHAFETEKGSITSQLKDMSTGSSSAIAEDHSANKSNSRNRKSTAPTPRKSPDKQVSAADLSQRLRELEEKMRALNRHRNFLSREVHADERESKAVEESMINYLVQALQQFSAVILTSPENDIEAVFKVISLWFENDQIQSVQKLISRLIKREISYKFIPLTYQLFSRIGVEDEAKPSFASAFDSDGTESKGSRAQGHSFQSILRKLVLQMCSDHPYHTLQQLFALANEEMVGNYVGAAQYKSNICKNRISGAKAILEQLFQDRKTRNLVNNMKQILKAYNDLAMTKTTEFQEKNRIHDISFREIQPKRGTSFTEVP